MVNINELTVIINKFTIRRLILRRVLLLATSHHDVVYYVVFITQDDVPAAATGLFLLSAEALEISGQLITL